ncbi:hypothetical protein HT102_14660 [Hoyosella sp. G463]|uniref:Peptidase MA-like domain-containing protein n=1 Tax=Lolliginicoccus lacisalsi TaxID=2742202 RepID=A0A927PN79_9ACTN|nr:hypothetical protein [Lolliginicoccus lacisalsi]MBD8507727.1 hypothetical protein [Lolliginicoccus lacisalsi]
MLAALLLLAVIALPACAGTRDTAGTGDPSGAGPTAPGRTAAGASSFDEQRRDAAQELLDRFARAQLAGDTVRTSGMIHPSAPQAFRAFHLERARNLAASDLDEWTYAVTDGPEAFVATEDVEEQGVRDAWAPEIRLRYSNGGEEPGVDRPSDMSLVLDGTQWLIGGAREPDPATWSRVPWDHGPTVERESQDGALVIAHPGDEALALEVVELLPEAAAAVTRRWPQPGENRPIIVEIASSDDEFKALTGGGLAAHEGTAPRSGTAVVAAAIANPVASPSPGSGQRIIIAGQAYAGLNREGQLAALSHEIAHVLTRSQSPMPLWLVEGIAELAAKGDRYPEPRSDATHVMDLVERYGPPDSLPRDDHFTGGGPASLLAYELAWTFVAYLSATHGDATVIEAYRMADAEGGGTQEFSRALEDTAEVTLPEAVEGWGRWLVR